MSTKGAKFLHLACQGGLFTPCPPAVTPLPNGEIGLY